MNELQKLKDLVKEQVEETKMKPLEGKDLEVLNNTFKRLLSPEPTILLKEGDK